VNGAKNQSQPRLGNISAHAPIDIRYGWQSPAANNAHREGPPTHFHITHDLLMQTPKKRR